MLARVELVRVGWWTDRLVSGGGFGASDFPFCAFEAWVRSRAAPALTVIWRFGLLVRVAWGAGRRPHGIDDSTWVWGAGCSRVGGGQLVYGHYGLGVDELRSRSPRGRGACVMGTPAVSPS